MVRGIYMVAKVSPAATTSNLLYSLSRVDSAFSPQDKLRSEVYATNRQSVRTTDSHFPDSESMWVNDQFRMNLADFGIYLNFETCSNRQKECLFVSIFIVA